MELGFPEITDSFLNGQNIVYTQFNDIEFYVEDIEQENLYFTILKNLFPDIRFDKIFPLGGKSNIFADAANNLGNKRKVYLVDLDFDEILGIKNDSINIFYLDRYSIENYLLDLKAIKEIVKEHKPKLKEAEIQNTFNLEAFKMECQTLFSDLVCCYLIIQKYNLGIENVKCDTARFCNFTNVPAILKDAQILAYHAQVKAALKIINPRLKFEAQVKVFKKYFRKLADALNNIPGKYLLNFLKYRIRAIFDLPQITLESFTYRLAKNCEFRDLLFLKKSVINYIN
jgi:hypothetical protein